MKRRTEYLVCKRDGRREWLRAAKLARSIAAAIEAAAGGAADGAAADASIEASTAITGAVIQALRRRADSARDSACAGTRVAPFLCTTAELAAAVERSLWATGRSRAAACYAAFRTRRSQGAFAVRGGVRGDERLASRALGTREGGAFDQN